MQALLTMPVAAARQSPSVQRSDSLSGDFSQWGSAALMTQSSPHLGRNSAANGCKRRRGPDILASSKRWIYRLWRRRANPEPMRLCENVREIHPSRGCQKKSLSLRGWTSLAPSRYHQVRHGRRPERSFENPR